MSTVYFAFPRIGIKYILESQQSLKLPQNKKSYKTSNCVHENYIPVMPSKILTTYLTQFKRTSQLSDLFPSFLETTLANHVRRMSNISTCQNYICRKGKSIKGGQSQQDFCKVFRAHLLVLGRDLARLTKGRKMELYSAFVLFCILLRLSGSTKKHY